MITMITIFSWHVFNKGTENVHVQRTIDSYLSQIFTLCMHSSCLSILFVKFPHNNVCNNVCFEGLIISHEPSPKPVYYNYKLITWFTWVHCLFILAYSSHPRLVAMCLPAVYRLQWGSCDTQQHNLTIATASDHPLTRLRPVNRETQTIRAVGGLDYIHTVLQERVT